jgi:hypothetical protein
MAKKTASKAKKTLGKKDMKQVKGGFESVEHAPPVTPVLGAEKPQDFLKIKLTD